MIDLEKDIGMTIALAGLLHDVGKFRQRALGTRTTEKQKEIYKYAHAVHSNIFFEKDLKDINDINVSLLESLLEDSSALASKHHKPDSNNIFQKIIQAADCISAGMDRDDDDGEDNINKYYLKTKLRSIFDNIEIKQMYKEKNNLDLNKINLEDLRDFKPTEIEQDEYKNLKDDYKKLWDGFLNEIKDLRELNNIELIYNSIYYLWKKYTSFIASSTQVEPPDISLFDHSRTTSAIANALYEFKDEKNMLEKEFIILKGDLSGIQNFIFKITEGEDKKGTAKILRGRSFYISLLTDIFSRYIVSEFNLTICNILYCGGGQFEIMLPLNQNIVNKLNEIEKDINRFLFESYEGLISCIFAYEKSTFDDLKQNKDKYGELLYEINNKMNKSKTKKFINLIQTEDVFINKEEIEKSNIKICKKCGLKIKTDKCDLCEKHKEIGDLIAKDKTKFLFFTKSNNKINIKDKIVVDFGKFGQVILTCEDESNWIDLVKKDKNKIKDIIKINSTENKIIKGFDFLGDVVPKNIETGQSLTFEEIADLSEGDNKLGILKMDVDNLGMIFAMGLPKNKKSISRIATLSRTLDMFFKGHLNNICKRVSNIFSPTGIDQQYFYITYSGGDDIFIVGSWDKLIFLSKEINEELNELTGYNKNISISGGIAVVKPKFPIHRSAEIAEELLSNSKNNGKGRLTIFGTCIEFDKFENILKLADEYVNLIKDNKLNRGLIHYVYSLKKYYGETYEENPEYIYKLIYKFYRTLDEKLADKLKKDIIDEKNFGYFEFIGTYVLEKTRGGN